MSWIYSTLLLSVALLIYLAVVFILIAVAVVIPDYMEKYSFYLWSSVVDWQGYAFTYVIYDIGKNILELVSGFILATNINAQLIIA